MHDTTPYQFLPFEKVYREKGAFEGFRLYRNDQLIQVGRTRIVPPQREVGHTIPFEKITRAEAIQKIRFP